MARLQSRRFEADFLDQLRERSPLAELIGRTVDLKRTGGTMSGCCPFHGETTPSFHVYPQRFHCFGCGVGGDAINFVMQRDHVSFPDAVHRLAGEAGMDVPGAKPIATSPEERARQVAAEQERLRQAEAKAIVDAKERSVREEAIARKAEAIWGKAKAAPADHPYLARKGIEAHDLRVDNRGNLLVPQRDEGADGKLWGLQTIHPDGKKMFLWRKVAGTTEGGRTKGLSHTLGEIDGAQAIVVAEGLATGASIREATGLPVRVAFSGNNLQAVVRDLRKQHPDLTIVMAADNDHQKERLTPPKANVGLEKGQDAIKGVPNTLLLAPSFAPADTGKDWNDFKAQGGSAPVKALFLAALSASPQSDLTMVASTSSQPSTPAASPGAPPGAPQAPVQPGPPAEPPLKSVESLVSAMVTKTGDNEAAKKYMRSLAEDLQQQPMLAEQPEFRLRVARGLQGVERMLGTSLNLEPGLREEMRAILLPVSPTAAASPVSGPSPEPQAPGHPAPTGEPSAPPSATTGSPRATPQGAAGPAPAPAPSAVPQATQVQGAAVPGGRFASAMASIYAALRPPTAATAPQWQQPPHPLGDKLQAYEERQADKMTQTLVNSATFAGQQAQRALEGLSRGPGGAVLGQIKKAAEGDPGGMEAVLSEMRPGGKYADLRTAFNGSLVQERAFVAAYDKAVSAISSYGDSRLKVSQSFAARKMDTQGVDQQFTDMDRAIAGAAEELPGRKNGMSVRDEIAEKAKAVGEFLKSLAERIRAAVAPSASPSASPTPTPASSPVPAFSI